MLRWLAVLLLCVATPAVQDIVSDLNNLIAGADDCCADECEESGAPCTQQCLHCVCGPRLVAAAAPDAPQLTQAWSTLPRAEGTTSLPSSAHLDPPFRPPVS
jgi:hypothetical protein